MSSIPPFHPRLHAGSLAGSRNRNAKNDHPLGKCDQPKPVLQSSKQMVRTRCILGLVILGLASTLAFGQQVGATWAVSIGISLFPNLEKSQQLEYAHADADEFASFIASQIGKDHVKVLLNKSATRTAVRRNIGTWLSRQLKTEDTVYLFFATHGHVVGRKERRVNLRLFDDHATDDREDLFPPLTDFFLEDLIELIQTRLVKARNTVVFLDACHAGELVRVVQRIVRDKSQLTAFLAGSQYESSLEGPQFCGGHGAFTCLLLKGLRGEADTNRDGVVTVAELAEYLNRELPKITNDAQHLPEWGNYHGNDLPLSRIRH